MASKVKQKAFFIIFKGISVVKNCLRPESVSLVLTEGINIMVHKTVSAHFTVTYKYET